MDYPLEQLDPERFQKVCQALLLPEFPSARFFPVGQADGGRDAFVTLHPRARSSKQLVVFQVKFARDPSEFRNLAARRKWVLDAVREELPKIEALAQNGARHYRLITNVRGSGRHTTGSIDKLDELLAGLPIHADGWWRDDLTSRLDQAWDVKWRYPELLTGPDLLRALVEGGLNEHAARRSSAVRAFLEEERHGDEKVKFKQVGLENSLLDLFVDLPLSSSGATVKDRRVAGALAAVAMETDDESTSHPSGMSFVDFEEGRWWGRTQSAPAASFLLHDTATDVAPWVVIEGAPGQGKSTVSQYLCQVHRYRLLNDTQAISRLSANHCRGGVRLPFRIDLRDLAAWLHGRNPFGEDEPEAAAGRRSFETFLTAQVEISSGGANFTVSDLHAVCRTSSLLLALDGLDEVADVGEREKVVSEASAGLRRLRGVALSLQTIITSRPAAFENSPGFARDQFRYFELAELTEAAVTDYSEKWIKARGLPQRSARDVRRVIKERLQAPHMRDLARNPMQLAILLSLVHQRGPSLPDKRTALYDNYVELFFDREAEKTPQVAEHRDLLLELHQFLAWRLQAEAETGNTEGSITDARLRELLRDYLQREEKDDGLVDVLFQSLVERVVAIVSRVQGTYEFEVQPLREYFAARFLHDTAHHSSPGNERAGDKTDRFDALARNFYWLNATRFFAGCFSRGELLSLVERLQALTTEDGMRHTNHPRVLSSMLLADWVFAQHPRSMKAVVDIVLRDVATRADSPSSTDVITLPPGSGRAEVVERCWELWSQALGPDRSSVVAQTLRANSEPAALDSEWLARATNADDEEGLTEWLNRGLWTGSLPRAARHDVEQLATRGDDGLLDDRRVRSVIEARHGAIYEADHELSEAAINSLLCMRTVLPVIREPRGPIEAIGQLWSLPYHMSNSLLSRGWSQDAPLFKGQKPPQHLEAAARVVEIAHYEAVRGPEVWQTSLAPWNTVIEQLRGAWGDCQLALVLAVSAAGIRAAGEQGSLGEGLFDADHSLALRARYARLRAGAGKWWSAQLNDAPDTFSEIFVVSLFFAWASQKTLRSEVGAFDSWIRRAGPSERGAVSSAVSTSRLLAPETRMPTRAEVDTLPEDLSPSTAVVMNRRQPYRPDGSPLQDRLYEKYLVERRLSDPAAKSLAAQSALSAAVKDDSRWDEALAAVRSAYTDGFASGRHLRYEMHSVTLPVPLARGVVEAWSEYPLAIVDLAEQACRQAVGQNVKTLESIARAQCWEWL